MITVSDSATYHQGCAAIIDHDLKKNKIDSLIFAAGYICAF